MYSYKNTVAFFIDYRTWPKYFYIVFFMSCEVARSNGPTINAYRPSIHTNAMPDATGWSKITIPTITDANPLITEAVLFVAEISSKKLLNSSIRPRAIKIKPTMSRKVLKATSR